MLARAAACPPARCRRSPPATAAPWPEGFRPCGNGGEEVTPGQSPATPGSQSAAAERPSAEQHGVAEVINPTCLPAATSGPAPRQRRSTPPLFPRCRRSSKMAAADLRVRPVLAYDGERRVSPPLRRLAYSIQLAEDPPTHGDQIGRLARSGEAASCVCRSSHRVVRARDGRQISPARILPNPLSHGGRQRHAKRVFHESSSSGHHWRRRHQHRRTDATPVTPVREFDDDRCPPTAPPAGKPCRSIDRRAWCGASP